MWDGLTASKLVLQGGQHVWKEAEREASKGRGTDTLREGGEGAGQTSISLVLRDDESSLLQWPKHPPAGQPCAVQGGGIWGCCSGDMSWQKLDAVGTEQGLTPAVVLSDTALW